MKIKTSIYTLLVALLLADVSVHAQSVKISSEDSLATEEGMIAKTDELYFEALIARRHEDNALAAQLLKKFIASRPSVGAAHFELARVYAEDKKMDLAIGEVKKAIELAPDNKWYRETYGNMLSSKKMHVEAAQIFASLTESEKNDEDYPEKAADNYEYAGQKEKAIEYIDIALRRNMDGEELMLRKMQLYMELNNVTKAAEVAMEMIATDPKNGKYYKLLGDLYDNNKMVEKATELYKKTLIKLPNDASVQVGMAAHSIRIGDTANYKLYLKKAIINNNIEAETQLELLSTYMQSLPNDGAAILEALPIVSLLAEQDPGNDKILAFYGEAFEMSDKRDSAAIMYKRTLEINPANFNIWGRLLGLYLEKPYADSLIKYSDKSIRLFPNQAIVHFYKGVGLMNKEQNAAAIKSMVRAIDLQPESEKDALSLMYSTLAEVYNTSKQYAQSDEVFDKALEMDPNNANVLNNYSYYLSERGVKLDAAERMSKKALELRPEEGTYIDTYGWILYKKGNYKQAKEYIQKAIDAAAGIGDGTLYDHLGDTHYQLNEKDKALEAWKKAKAKGCDNSKLDKKISEGKLYE